MNPQQAAIILSRWLLDEDITSVEDLKIAANIALIILIAFNNTLEEVTK